MGNMLVPFKKFLSNKNTITILGVLLGVVVLYLGYNWRVSKSINPIKVPFCTQTLVSGTKITEEYINYLDIPKETVGAMTNLVTDVNKIKDMLVSYDSKIPQNGFFFSENLMTEDEMPNSVYSNIQDGYTIYDLHIDADAVYGNTIMPGATIDIYMSTEQDDLLVFGRFISQIQVLAVKDGDGKNAFADAQNPTDGEVLLFAVPENLFLLLKKATKLGIELEPVPRNESYTNSAGAVELESDELEAMIIKSKAPQRNVTITDERRTIATTAIIAPSVSRA